MVRMCVAGANRLAELALSQRGKMGPSYIVPAALLGTLVLVGAYVLRAPFHWLMSGVGK
jgi:hypothetical protein